jgi:hypothetical protein
LELGAQARERRGLYSSGIQSDYCRLAARKRQSRSLGERAVSDGGLSIVAHQLSLRRCRHQSGNGRCVAPMQQSSPRTFASLACQQGNSVSPAHVGGRSACEGGRANHAVYGEAVLDGADRVEREMRPQ